MGAETQDRVRYVPPDCSQADREALKRLGYEVRDAEAWQVMHDGRPVTMGGRQVWANGGFPMPRKPQD